MLGEMLGWLTPGIGQLPIIIDEDKILWAILVFTLIGAIHALPRPDWLKIELIHDDTDSLFIGVKPTLL